MRAKILALTASQAKQLGVGKSMFHYLRQNAKRSKSFRVYEKVRRRLDSKGRSRC
ncbi:MAG: hypothetical protein WB661_01935 [Candidatus Bathyarchaeia archaeon]